MKYYILFNPMAGHGNIESKATELSATLKGDITCIDMTKIESYSDFFASVENDDTLILCGGDGTINRFINDTEGIDIKCDVLYFAAGTGNDFLRDLDIKSTESPLSVKHYIADLPSVEVNGRTYRFLNNVGFGIDGYCCEVGDELKRTSSKPVNYTSIAIKGLLFHYQPTNATVIVDGTEYSYKKVWLAPTMKGRYYGGGMMASPEQDRNDPNGEISVMIFYGKGRLRTLMAFPSIFKGEHVNHKNMVNIHKGQEITVRFDRPATIQIDGETITGVTEYTAHAKIPAGVV